MEGVAALLMCTVCLFVYSTVRSTAFTTKDIVVSGSDDRTVKVCSLHCVCDQKLRDFFCMYSTKNSDLNFRF